MSPFTHICIIHGVDSRNTQKDAELLEGDHGDRLTLVHSVSAGGEEATAVVGALV